MRGLILSILLIFTLNVKSQEVQLLSNEVYIDGTIYNIEPNIEIFKINLTDSLYVYTVIEKGIILYSYKSKIYEYNIENGVVLFTTDDFNLRLKINKNNCELSDIRDEGLIWTGECSIDFSIMLRK
jgi:hypothetical protein